MILILSQLHLLSTSEGGSISRAHRYLGLLQRLVDLVGVELEALKVDDLVLVGLEGEVDLAGQRAVHVVAQHYPQQVLQQLRVLQLLHHF